MEVTDFPNARENHLQFVFEFIEDKLKDAGINKGVRIDGLVITITPNQIVSQKIQEDICE